MRTAVYPGSFDPITNGHLDIIRRAGKLYDKLIVGVLNNPGKKTPMFSVEERMEMIRSVTEDIPNVEVDSFEGLLVDFAKANGANVIIKGLRTVADFEYEFQMAAVNKKLDPDIETLFMVASDKYTFLSSSVVRELRKYRSELASFVPKVVEEAVCRKLPG